MHRAPSFSFTRIERGKRIPVFLHASSSIGSPRRRVFAGLPCLAFVQDDSSSLSAQDADAYGHSAGCKQVCVSQSNDYPIFVKIFSVLLKIKKFLKLMRLIVCADLFIR